MCIGVTRSRGNRAAELILRLQVATQLAKRCAEIVERLGVPGIASQGRLIAADRLGVISPGQGVIALGEEREDRASGGTA